MASQQDGRRPTGIPRHVKCSIRARPALVPWRRRAMSNGLFLDLSQHGDPESIAIIEHAARNNDLGAGWAFVRNRRTLHEYLEYRQAERALKRMLKPEPRWSDPW